MSDLDVKDGAVGLLPAMCINIALGLLTEEVPIYFAVWSLVDSHITIEDEWFGGDMKVSQSQAAQVY